MAPAAPPNLVRGGRFALGAVFVCIVVFAGIRCSGRAREVEITLLSMNDFHGALVHGGVDHVTGRPWGGALALEARLREQRRLRPKRTFLFDAGDQMQGTPESNLSFGRSSVGVLRRLGVDAAALGNHEFDWGVDTLRSRIRDMPFPMLAANVFWRQSGERPRWLQPTAMLERDGIRVGVIGLITPNTPRVTMPLHVVDFVFTPPDSGVATLAAELRAEGADIVVVVAHLGASQREDGVIEGALADLAARVAGIDAILGGHRHNVVAGHVAGIPVVVASSRGRALGRVTLVWDGKRVTRSEAIVLPAYADSLVADTPLAAYVDSVAEAVRPYVSRVLAHAYARFDEEALAHLVADAMRAAVDADVAITNIGGVRSDLAAGSITEGDLFEVVPFENTLVVTGMRGAALRACLASRPHEARVAGLRARLETMPSGAVRVVDARTDEGDLVDDRIYRVVTNNFIAHGGDGFVGFLDAEQVEWSRVGVRAAVRDYLVQRQADDGGVRPESRARLERKTP